MSWVRSVAIGIVDERVTVSKDANRTLIVTVRPAIPLCRSRRPTFSASRSRMRWQASGSSRSSANVCSADTLLAGSWGTTVRSSMPRARRCSPAPWTSPSTRARVRASLSAIWPTVRNP